MSKPLYIFLHIPRTGGTTFRRHIRKNFSKDQRLALRFEKEKLGKKNLGLDYYRSKNEHKIKKLSLQKKRKIKVIYGHGVTYGVHKYFKRQARYVVFLREPAKRVQSLYNYILMDYKDRKKKNADLSDYKHLLLFKSRVPSFKDWVHHKYGVDGNGTETIAQHFMLLGYLRKKSTKSIKKMLDRFYYVGLTETLGTDLNYLYSELGVKKYFLNINISKKYVNEISVEAMSLLNDKHKLDNIIYRLVRKKRTEFVKNTPDYYKKVRGVKFKKMVLLPITQFLFDLRGGLVELSWYLKRRSTLYEKAFDYIRGYKI